MSEEQDLKYDWPDVGKMDISFPRPNEAVIRFEPSDEMIQNLITQNASKWFRRKKDSANILIPKARKTRHRGGKKASTKYQTYNNIRIQKEGPPTCSTMNSIDSLRKGTTDI